MKLNRNAAGVYAIAPTPFLDDGAIDFDSVDRLVDFYQQSGCTGITALGIMGESTKLDGTEAVAVASRFIARSTLPVVIGVSAPGFAAMRSLARAAMDLGAAGVMIAPPHTLRTDDQLQTYFAQAVDAIGADVPWVLQDFPLGIGVVISPSVVRQIIADNPSCVMLKHEDWPGLEKLTTLRGYQDSGTMAEISILCGNGGMFLDFELGRGANGAMTGYGFVDALVDIVKAAQAGDVDAAHDLFDAHLPLMRYEQQPNAGLAVRKYILARRGIIGSARQRKPGSPISDKARQEIEFLLSRLSLRDARAGESRVIRDEAATKAPGAAARA